MRTWGLLLIFIFLTACFQEKEEEGLLSGHATATNSLSTSVPSDGYYLEGDILTFSVRHSYAVTVTGVPRIPITLDTGGTVYADYFSGSGSTTIYFRYTILATQVDSDGITVAANIDLNGGSMQYSNEGVMTDISLSLGLITTSGIKVDAVAPAAPVVTYPTSTTFYQGQTMLFMAQFAEVVEVTGTPRIGIDVNGTVVYANYVSGSGSTNLFFNYEVQAADIDPNLNDIVTPLDLNSGTIKDLAGNNSALDFVSVTAVANTVEFDGDTPHITSITAPANDTYLAGETVSVTLNFSERVYVVGTPQVDVTVGAESLTFDYASGDGTTALVFEYVVSSGDSDSDGIQITSPLTMNGGTIRDGGALDTVETFSTPLTPNVIVDAGVPEVQTITASPDGSYTTGQQLVFILNYDVPVTISGGSFPNLQLNIGGSIVQASYLNGSGTTSITFSYNVTGGDSDNDGIAIVSTLNNNGATIRGANGVDATPDLTTGVGSIDTSGILVNP